MALALAAAVSREPGFENERQVKGPPEPGQSTTISNGMSFAYVPAGRIVMGSAWDEPNRQYDEYPHPVNLTKGFWMSTTEVTQGQWKAVMGDSRSHFSGDQLPVESVSWSEAVAFCERLSRKEGRAFRLPTEAEWEYACRAGGDPKAGGNVSLDEAGWYATNSDDRTHTVAEKKPNLWGLFNMLGNVSEWCSDTYQAEYPREEVIDPIVQSARGAKVVRGGSWASFARSCRCAARSSTPAAYQEKETGFRVVMDAEPEKATAAVIKGLAWLDRAIPYPDPAPTEDKSILGETYKIWFAGAGPARRGDTFPVTWADDGALYTSSGDPHWGKKATGLDVEKLSGIAPGYYISKVNEMDDYVGNGGEGPKPTGMISVDGLLYLAFQNLLGKKPPVYGSKSQHGNDAAIIASSDHGLTWHPDKRSILNPMFPGATFGGPAFINLGQNNQDARDNFVYAVSTDQWDNGSHLRLGRVSKDRILEAGAWEWVSGVSPAGDPSWTSHLEQSVPVLTRERQISLPEMVYLRSIKRYLLLTWRLKQDFSPANGSELFVYEAKEPWGPFLLVHHEPEWEDSETTPYCPRLPLKWIDQSAEKISGWILFSGSWRENSPHYRAHVRPFRLLLRN